MAVGVGVGAAVYDRYREIWKTPAPLGRYAADPCGPDPGHCSAGPVADEVEQQH